MIAFSPANSVRLAAVFAARLRPRQFQLNPRVFHILSRPLARPNVYAFQQRTFTVAARCHIDAPKASAEDNTGSIPEVPHEILGEEETVDGGAEAIPAQVKSNGETNMQEQRKLFTGLMRTVPHPLAIVTAQPPRTEENETSVVGATVSSFNTVSLDPDIVVSFNLTQASATYRSILDSKRFCISFPVNNKAGSELAQRFTEGNKTPPLHPDLIPSIQGLYWNDTLALTFPNIKDCPPAVALKNKALPTGDAGFAFALLFEYQNSLPVGDHVIVTGRFIPRQIRSSKKYGWGHQIQTGSAFATSHLILAYAHGAYGFVDNGMGIDNFWKHDDLYKWADFATLDRLKVKNARQAYKSRINVIRHGRMLQQGQELPPNRTVGDGVRRASELPVSRLDEMEAYYTERLKLVKERLAQDSKSEDLVGPGRSDIPGWQNLLIRKKMLLSDKELKKEDALYLARFHKLKDQVSSIEKSQSSTADAATSQATNEVDNTTAQSAELERLKELKEHARERLMIIREAQRRKQGVEQTIEVKKLNQHQITRFLESKRQRGYDDLKKGYRRDLFQIQEARLSLLEMENRPDIKDEEAVKQLNDRIDYYTETSELLAALIAERIAQADPMELNAKIKRPLLGMDGPPPAPESRMRMKRNHGFEIVKLSMNVSGVRDENSNWKFPDKNKIGTMWKRHARKMARGAVSADEGPADDVTAQDLQEMHASQVAARQTSAEGELVGNARDEEDHDALVMKHYENEKIPVWPTHEKKG